MSEKNVNPNLQTKMDKHVTEPKAAPQYFCYVGSTNVTVVTARHSQGSPLPGFATPRVHHSQGSPLPGSATPRVPHYIR